MTSCLFACLYHPPPVGVEPVRAEADGQAAGRSDCLVLVEIAQQFSPRYERHGDRLVTIDVSGLERLLGSARTIGEELRREAAARGVRAHVAVAATRLAAMVLALARPGVTVVPGGGEAEALRLVPIAMLDLLRDQGVLLSESSRRTGSRKRGFGTRREGASRRPERGPVPLEWGVRTLGELAALPSSDLSARLGQQGLLWQAVARGEDVRPLVPALADERFEASLDLEWPIEGIEPLSFVLTRLLEPLSARLERRDRGAAALHIVLRLTTRDLHARRLQLPSPIRDVRALRTLALLDLEYHPPPAAIDRVTVTIEPTPGRVLQHTLFARPRPSPEQIATLLARLGALMGQDRIGAPGRVDSHRPGAFEMQAFAADHTAAASRGERGGHAAMTATGTRPAEGVMSALRRCRQPVPARVLVDDRSRPVRVTTDRRGAAGGQVVSSAGPWRTSGDWWSTGAWSRDEWDVALDDGAVYRVFRDRDRERWFIDGMVD